VVKCSLWISVLRPKAKNRLHIVRIGGYEIKENPDNTNNFSFIYPLVNLPDKNSGEYKLSIAGYDNLNTKVFQSEDNFFIENSFLFSDIDYYEMVNRLMYIASDAEMKSLKQSSLNTRDSAWSSFWKKYDPNPATEINEAEQDYFSRIDYCIDNFSKGDKGYRSSRAVVYMKYGTPDFVESRPFERYSNAYEIWYYYNIGIQFTFIDEHGFGEYTFFEEKRI
jgi:GWxTD domain-containing protein